MVLYEVHHTQEVASPELLDVVWAEAFCTEPTGEVDDLGCIGTTDDASVTVKVGAYAHMVDACHVYHVCDVAHGVVDGGEPRQMKGKEKSRCRY